MESTPPKLKDYEPDSDTEAGPTGAYRIPHKNMEWLEHSKVTGALYDARKTVELASQEYRKFSAQLGALHPEDVSAFVQSSRLKLDEIKRVEKAAMNENKFAKEKLMEFDAFRSNTVDDINEAAEQTTIVSEENRRLLAEREKKAARAIHALLNVFGHDEVIGRIDAASKGRSFVPKVDSTVDLQLIVSAFKRHLPIDHALGDWDVQKVLRNIEILGKKFAKAKATGVTQLTVPFSPGGGFIASSDIAPVSPAQIVTPQKRIETKATGAKFPSPPPPPSKKSVGKRRTSITHDLPESADDDSDIEPGRDETGAAQATLKRIRELEWNEQTNRETIERIRVRLNKNVPDLRKNKTRLLSLAISGGPMSNEDIDQLAAEVDDMYIDPGECKWGDLYLETMCPVVLGDCIYNFPGKPKYGSPGAYITSILASIHSDDKVEIQATLDEQLPWLPLAVEGLTKSTNAKYELQLLRTLLVFVLDHYKLQSLPMLGYFLLMAELCQRSEVIRKDGLLDELIRRTTSYEPLCGHIFLDWDAVERVIFAWVLSKGTHIFRISTDLPDRQSNIRTNAYNELTESLREAKPLDIVSLMKNPAVREYLRTAEFETVAFCVEISSKHSVRCIRTGNAKEYIWTRENGKVKLCTEGFEVLTKVSPLRDEVITSIRGKGSELWAEVRGENALAVERYLAQHHAAECARAGEELDLSTIDFVGAAREARTEKWQTMKKEFVYHGLISMS